MVLFQLVLTLVSHTLSPAFITGRKAAEGRLGESIRVRHGFELPVDPNYSVFQARYKVCRYGSRNMYTDACVLNSMSAWAHEKALQKLEAEEAAIVADETAATD